MDPASEIDLQFAQTLNLVYTRNALVATMTVVLLEYFHLFELERRLVWPLKWKLPKVLFIISRYLPFLFVTLFLYHNSAPTSTSPRTCQGIFGVASVGLVVACLCSDAVLYLRLYALSKQDFSFSSSRLVKIVLACNFAVVSVICLLGISLFLHSETFVPSLNLLPMTPCIHWGPKASKLWLTICYAVLLYSSLFTTALSLWYGVRLYLTMRPIPPSTLIKIFHRDGAIYFICIATISLTNAFIALLAPLQYRYLLPTTQGMVHSILATRMILHLREVAQETLVVDSRNPNRTSGSRKHVDQRWDLSSKPVNLSDFVAASNWGNSEGASSGSTDR